MLVIFCLVLAHGSIAAAAPPGTPQLVPSDPGYQVYPHALNQIDAPAAWAATTGSPSVTIAVIDSGVAPVPDLAPALLPGQNFWPQAADTSDPYGHGTKVASVIGSQFNNSGIAGVCPGCRILPVRVMGPNGHWNAQWTAPAVDWAVNQGARVINLSLWQLAGSSEPAILASIQNAVNRGVVVVLIAGNGINDNFRGSSDPSSNPIASGSPSAIRVAGVDPNGQLNLASNRGTGWVDIAAPFTTMALNPGGATEIVRGTSFSAPLVAGVVGLMLSVNPSLTPSQVRDILKASGSVVPGLDVACGCVLNAYQALLAAGYRPPVNLAIENSGSGSGSVVSEPAGINCGDACSGTFESGSNVKLTATADEGSTFVGWSGACNGSAPTCSVTLSGDTSVTATFTRRQVDLVVRKKGKGTVSRSCNPRCTASAVPWGTTVKLTAKPFAGWKFARWNGLCRGTRPICILKVNKSGSVLAVFMKK